MSPVILGTRRRRRIVLEGVTVTAFRWRNDDGGEDGATWIDEENEAIQVSPGQKVRVRVQVTLGPDAFSGAIRVFSFRLGAVSQ
jgi:hypothetical protein